MSKFSSIISWIQEHALLIGTAFLLVFIPLYPKLPLFDIIPGYIVRVRLEDLFVLLIASIWAWKVWQGQIAWKSRITYAVLAYIAVGLLSSLSAMFITQTVPLTFVHIGKTFLHYIRYIEYFSLLFITMAAIRTRQHLKIVLGVIVVTLLAISIYGYGQKHWYWPVYSTMNREFSKGVRLYLTEHARVQSTFGGHYDLSAYLVLILPVILAGWYFVKQRWLSLLLAAAFLMGTWLLIVAGSRSSFGSFVVAGSLVVVLYALKQYQSWKQKIVLGGTQVILFGLLSGSMLLYFGADMYERFVQTLEGYPELHERYQSVNETREETWDSFVGFFITEEQSKRFSDMTKGKKPKNAKSVEEVEAELAEEEEKRKAAQEDSEEDDSVLTKSDERPTPNRPRDVYEDIPDVVTVSTRSADGRLEYVEVEKDRIFSDNAFRHGLSMAIRFDTLWPQALQGFYTNPILGTGYATLTKETVGQFTEADSTDNNFLRTLGETGLLGFVSFYGVIGLVNYRAWKLYKNRHDWLISIFAVSFLAGSAGLLFNALLIDVFAASKVAFTFWTLAGIIIAIENIDRPNVHRHVSEALSNQKQQKPDIKKPHQSKKNKTTRS
ncbi:MAG: hypothetical protein WDZ94_02030 [Patescibacteria group bacterium]